jgi:hypothetical protein
MRCTGLGLLLIPFLLLSILTCQSIEWRKGRYWYFVDNINIEENESPEILFWVALPMNHRGQQVKIEQIYPKPIEIIHDTINGNEIVFWRETELVDKKEMYFYYDFHVLPEKVEMDIDPEKITPYQKDTEEYKRYTKSEPWIEITPEIEKKAQEIIAEATNPYYQAKKIFNWVVDNMSYEYPDVTQRGAAKSFKKLKGDCGEFSYVFEALCRSVGIPARGVTCMWFQGGGHAWAEILLPPYGWIPVDASVADMLTSGSNVLSSEEAVLRFMESRGIPEKDPNYLFGNLYPNRLIVYIGANVQVVSQKTGLQKTFRFMQPGANAAFPPSIEFKGFSDKTVHGGFYLFDENSDDFKFAQSIAEKELAFSYLNAEIYDKAERGLLKKIDEKPEDALSWLNLGQVYMHKKEYDQAIDAFNKSIVGKAGSVKPVIDVWAHTLLGNCYDLKGMREQAIKEYEKVVASGINFQGVVDTAKKYIKEPYNELTEK